MKIALGFLDKCVEERGITRTFVRDGDQPTSAVPELATLILLGFGLFGLGAVGRRMK